MGATLTRGLTPVRTVLANGAVLLAQQTSMAPAVTINVTFHAGGVHEPPDLPGLAYFVGRVLDRGTHRRSADAIAEELDALGVALRVANTRHVLAMSCTCLTDDFDAVLPIIVDVARRPIFPEDEIEKRRAELLTAIRQDDDNPSVRAMEGLSELLYGEDHPYGRPSKGTPGSAERMTRRDLQSFHASWMRPAALSVAIVGDVPPELAIERAIVELDDWTAAPPEHVPVAPPAGAPGRRTRVISMAGKAQTDIAYGFTAVRRLDPRYYAYWIMNNVLGQFGLGGRLADNIRERQGMAYYAFSAFDASEGEGPLQIRAGVDPHNVERAVEAIDMEVRRMGVEGPTAEEVAESRQYLIGSIPRLLETNQSIAVFLQTTEYFGLGTDYDRQLPRLLEAVTLDEVAAAASETLRPECAALAIAGPAPDAGE